MRVSFHNVMLLAGAGGGGRTRTVSLPLDFESSTSANSITPAKTNILYNAFYKKASVIFLLYALLLTFLYF